MHLLVGQPTVTNLGRRKAVPDRNGFRPPFLANLVPLLGSFMFIGQSVFDYIPIVSDFNIHA